MSTAERINYRGTDIKVADGTLTVRTAHGTWQAATDYDLLDNLLLLEGWHQPETYDEDGDRDETWDTYRDEFPEEVRSLGLTARGLRTLIRRWERGY